MWTDLNLHPTMYRILCTLISTSLCTTYVRGHLYMWLNEVCLNVNVGATDHIKRQAFSAVAVPKALAERVMVRDLHYVRGRHLRTRPGGSGHGPPSVLRGFYVPPTFSENGGPFCVCECSFWTRSGSTYIHKVSLAELELRVIRSDLAGSIILSYHTYIT